MSKEKGLFNKYKIEKTSGKPMDERGKYFVLRYDEHGEYFHVKASRKALEVYADEIECVLPQLAEDIREDIKQ